MTQLTVKLMDDLQTLATFLVIQITVIIQKPSANTARSLDTSSPTAENVQVFTGHSNHLPLHLPPLHLNHMQAHLCLLTSFPSWHPTSCKTYICPQDLPPRILLP